MKIYMESEEEVNNSTMAQNVGLPCEAGCQVMGKLIQILPAIREDMYHLLPHLQRSYN